MKKIRKKKRISIIVTAFFLLASVNLFGNMINSLQAQGKSDNGSKLYYVVPEKDEETSGKSSKK